jgi:large subunit ribosomal protein L28
MILENLKEVLEMAKCEICEKEKVFSMQVSHSHRRSARTFKPNLRTVKAVVDGASKKMTVCSRCLRSGKVERA